MTMMILTAGSHYSRTTTIKRLRTKNQQHDRNNDDPTTTDGAGGGRSWTASELPTKYNRKTKKLEENDGR